MVAIERLRGIETPDCNDYFVIVKAPIQTVASALTETRQATVWEQDVCDREIEIMGDDFVVFQFRGHSWTLIHYLRIQETAINERDAEALARHINTDAIYYKISDSACYIGYQLYDSTGLVESFYREGQQPVKFQSLRRQTTDEIINSLGLHVFDFLKEQDIYVPSISLPRCTVGERIILQVGVSIDDPDEPYPPAGYKTIYPITDKSLFERCDHVGIKY